MGTNQEDLLRRIRERKLLARIRERKAQLAPAQDLELAPAAAQPAPRAPDVAAAPGTPQPAAPAQPGIFSRMRGALEAATSRPSPRAEGLSKEAAAPLREAVVQNRDPMAEVGELDPVSGALRVVPRLVGTVLESFGNVIQAAPGAMGAAREALVQPLPAGDRRPGEFRTTDPTTVPAEPGSDPSIVEQFWSKHVSPTGRALEEIGSEIRQEAKPSQSVREGGPFQPGNWRWWLESGGDAVAQLGMQFGAATLTGGMSAIPRILAFASPIAVLEAGSSYSQIKEAAVARGVPLEDAEQMAGAGAVLTGAGNTALEFIPGKFFLDFPGVSQRFGQRFAELLATRAGRTAGGMSTELIQEVTQNAFADAVQYSVGQDPEAFRGALQRYLGEGVLAAGAGGVAGLAQGSSEVPPRKQREEEVRQLLEFMAKVEEEAPATAEPPAEPPAAVAPVPEPVVQEEPAPAPTVQEAPAPAAAQEPASPAPAPEAAPEAPEAPAPPWRAREVAPATVGRRQRTVFPGDNRKVETEFAVVEADEVRASHTADFAQRAPEEFPAEIQGRAYHGTRGRQAREHTESIITGFDPDRAFDPTVTAAEGPPVVTQNGINVAGNGRTIAQQRLYQMNPTRAEQLLKQELVNRAAEFGVDPEVVAGMQRPMLVRRIVDGSIDQGDAEQLRGLNQASDIPSGKAKDVVSDAASRAQQFRAASGALRHFTETVPEDATIRSYLGSSDGLEFLRQLIVDGVIGRGERARFIDATTGSATADGKQLVESMFYAAAIGDADVLARAPEGVLRKLDTALPSIIRAGQVEGWDIGPTVRDALDLLATARAQDLTIDDLDPQAHGYQPDMMREPPDPKVVKMARFLEEAPKNSRGELIGVKDSFRKYADDAEAFSRQSQSDDLFGYEATGPESSSFAALTAVENPPAVVRTAEEAFDGAFQSSLSFTPLDITSNGEVNRRGALSVDRSAVSSPSTTSRTTSSPSTRQTPRASLESFKSSDVESVKGVSSSPKVASGGFPTNAEGQVQIQAVPMWESPGGRERLELTDRYNQELGAIPRIEQTWVQPIETFRGRLHPQQRSLLESAARVYGFTDPKVLRLAESIYATIEAQQDSLRGFLEGFGVDAEFVFPGPKPFSSFWNKVRRKAERTGGDPIQAIASIGDVMRGSLVTESLRDAHELAQRIMDSGSAIEFDDYHATADRGLGYGAYHLQLRTLPGMVVELQIHTRHGWNERAFYGGHDIYDLLESKERIEATSSNAQRRAWAMLEYTRDGYARAMRAGLDGETPELPRYAMRFHRGSGRWAIHDGEVGPVVQMDGRTPQTARELRDRIEANPPRSARAPRESELLHPLYDRDLFGQEFDTGPAQGELLPSSSAPQGITAALEQARATVSSLEGRVTRGVASDSEVKRYEEARSLIRRSEGRGLDRAEVARTMERERARRQLAAGRTPDTGDLFAPLAPAQQAAERLPAAGGFIEGSGAIENGPMQIIEQLHGSLDKVLDGGLKLAEGKLGRVSKSLLKGLGVMRSRANVVRLADISDVAVFGHEAGHVMHKLFFGTSPKGALESAALKQALPAEVELELMQLAQGISDGSLREGWADYWRRYLDNPAQLAKDAPKSVAFVDQLLEQYPSVKEAWRLAQQDWTAFRSSSAQERVGSRISVGDRQADVLSIEDRWSRFRTAVVDDFEPIRRVVQHIRDRGKLVTMEEDAEQLARLSRGSVGVGMLFLEHGVVDYHTAQTHGKGLKQILEPVNDRLDDFRRYIVSRRAQELHERDILTGIRAQDADAVVEQLGSPEFEKAFDEIQEWNRGLLTYLLDAGVISQKTFDAILELNKNYVPYYRVVEGAGAGGLGETFGHLFSPVKRIKGSGRDIIDPLESMVKNAYLYTQIAQKQAVSNALGLLAEKEGVGKILEEFGTPIRRTQFQFGEVEKQLKELVPGLDELLEELRADPDADYDPAEELLSVFRPGDYFGKPNMISVLVEGKRRWYEVDPELYAALEGLNREQAGTVARILGIPANLLRAGATLAPEFQIRNPLRDQVMAFIQSEYGYTPFVDLARGMFELVRKGDAYKQWLATGGYRAALLTLDRNSMQRSMNQLLKSDGVPNVVKNPLDALRALSALMEDSTRMGEFLNAREKLGQDKESLQTGSGAAREISIDFNRHGAKTAFLRSTAAFWNARLQGYDRLAREAKTNPKRFALRTFAIITLPSLLEYFANKDDEDYWELPQWQRDLFWMVKVGEDFIRIPKPFELGLVFGTLPVRMLDGVVGGPGGWEEVEDFLTGLVKGEVGGFIPTPTAIIPLIENVVNYSFFLRRPIVPRSEQEVRPEYQAGPYTSEVAQQLARWLPNASPRKIDNLLSSYTGGLGRVATEIVDAPLELGKPKGPARKVTELPGVRGVTTRNPGFGSESVERFYEEYSKARIAVQTLRYLEDSDNQEAYQRELESEEYSRLRSLEPSLRATAGILGKLRAQEEQIRMDRTMTPDEKRERMDELGQQARQAAQAAINRTMPGGG